MSALQTEPRSKIPKRPSSRCMLFQDLYVVIRYMTLESRSRPDCSFLPRAHCIISFSEALRVRGKYDWFLAGRAGPPHGFILGRFAFNDAVGKEDEAS